MSDRQERWAVFWCSLLSPLLYGEIPPEEAGRFLEQLASCEQVFPDGQRRRPSRATLWRKWVIYHKLMTLCINHTHGDSFSMLCLHQCCGAWIFITCLLALKATSIAHLRENVEITQLTSASRSVVNRYLSSNLRDHESTSPPTSRHRPER